MKLAEASLTRAALLSFKLRLMILLCFSSTTPFQSRAADAIMISQTKKEVKPNGSESCKNRSVYSIIPQGAEPDSGRNGRTTQRQPAVRLQLGARRFTYIKILQNLPTLICTATIRRVFCPYGCCILISLHPEAHNPPANHAAHFSRVFFFNRYTIALQLLPWALSASLAPTAPIPFQPDPA